MTKPMFEPLTGYASYPETEMSRRATEFTTLLRRRRTVRQYSARDVPDGVIEACIDAAASAPNGANMQPWHFVVVRDPAIKTQIRKAAEQEERAFYAGRASREWLEALAPLGTDEHKPYLEIAPTLIVVFAQPYRIAPDGGRVKHYYVAESVGIATGLLVTALHVAGLASLVHTPSPMGFLNALLARPAHERPFVIVVTGYPADDTVVPTITKKAPAEVTTYF